MPHYSVAQAFVPVLQLLFCPGQFVKTPHRQECLCHIRCRFPMLPIELVKGLKSGRGFRIVHTGGSRERHGTFAEPEHSQGAEIERRSH